MNKKIISLIILIVFVFGLFGTIGCAKKEEDVIKIGAILPLTGSGAFLGIEEKNALKLFEEKKIEIDYFDSQGKGKNAITIFNQNLNKYDIFFVSQQSPVKSIIPISEKKKKILSAFTVNPDISDTENKLNYTYRYCVSGKQEFQLISKYLNSKNFKNIYYIGERSDYSQKAYEILKNNLKNKKFKYDFVENVSDIKNVVAKSKKDDIDLYVTLSYPKLLINILKEININNPNVPIISNVNLLYIKDFAAKLSNKTYNVVPKFALDQNSEFVSRYKNKYGKAPTWNGAYTYDNIQLINEIISKMGKFSPDKYMEHLKSIDFTGVTGDLKLKEDSTNLFSNLYLVSLDSNGEYKVITKQNISK